MTFELFLRDDFRSVLMASSAVERVETGEKGLLRRALVESGPPESVLRLGALRPRVIGGGVCVA